MAHIEEPAGLLEQLTDVQAVDRAHMGDELAFVEVARRHGPAAWRIALVTGGSTGVAISAVGRGLSRTLDLPGGSGVPFRLLLLRVVRSLASERRGDRADDLYDLAVELAGDEPPRIEVVAYARLPETLRVALWLAETEHLDAPEIEFVLELGTGEGARVLDTARAAVALQAQRKTSGLPTRYRPGPTGTITDSVRAEAMATFAVAVPAVVAADAVKTWRGSHGRPRAAAPGWAPTMTSTTRSRGSGSRTRLMAGAAALLIVAGAVASVTTDGGNVVPRPVTEADSAAPGHVTSGRPAHRDDASLSSARGSRASRSGASRSGRDRELGHADKGSEPATAWTIGSRTGPTGSDGARVTATNDKGGTSGARSPDAADPPGSTGRTSTPRTSTPSTVEPSPPTTAGAPPTTRPVTTSPPSPPTTRPPSPSTTQPPSTTTTTDPIGSLVCRLLPICPSVP